MRYTHGARLEVHQADRMLASARTPLRPGRSVQLDAGWVERVDPAGSPVAVSVR